MSAHGDGALFQCVGIIVSVAVLAAQDGGVGDGDERERRSASRPQTF